MNKRGRERNFAFGTTDQSNSHRKPLLMRAVQEKKGGRQGESEREEEYGTPFLHRGGRKKRGDESYTAPSGRNERVCAHWMGVVVI